MVNRPGGPAGGSRFHRGGKLLLGIAAAACVVLFLSSKWDQSEHRRTAVQSARDGAPEAALSDLLPLLERDPSDREVQQAVAIAMVRANRDLGEIDPHSRRWTELDPGNPAAWELRLEVLRKLFRSASEQIPVLEKLAELQPSRPDRKVELASHYFLVGRYDESIALARSLRDQGLLPPAQLSVAIARAELARGNETAAAAELDALPPGAMSSSQVSLLRATIHRRRNENEKAVSLLKGLRPDDLSDRIDVLNQLGQAFAATGKREEAERAFAELTQLQDAQQCVSDAEQRAMEWPFQIRAASAMRRAGLPREAIRVLTSALDRIGPSRAPLLLLAECCDEAGDAARGRAARAEAAALP